MIKFRSSEKDLFCILTFIIVSLLIFIYCDDQARTNKEKELEYKINQQQVDIEELYLRSEALFKRDQQ